MIVKYPDACLARYENDVCVQRVTCFFCQRESGNSALDGRPLRLTHIWWMGKVASAPICVRCMIFLEVPPTAPAFGRICDFCGYPGGMIMPYEWNWDNLEAPYIQYGTIELHTQHLNAWTMRVFGTRYMCCQQCSEFFGRNPLQEPVQ